MTEKQMTGYPSKDKPWLQYYPKEVINEEIPTCTIYEYLWENNKEHMDDIALLYFNKKVTYEQLFYNVDLVAKALIANGVKKGDIVTVAMPSMPEVVYCIYALNKIRAIANLIHPLAGEKEIVDYLNEVNSSLCIMFTGTYHIVKNSLNKTPVKKVVVAYPTESLGYVANSIYKLKEQKVYYDKKIISWKNFIKSGNGIQVFEHISSDCYETSIMSHTGGTTGIPKCVMLSDYNANSVIWQIGCNLPHERQEIMLVCLPPFINYSLTNAILEPLAFGFQVVLIPDYKPEKFGEYVRKYRFNHINSIPAYWEALLKCNDLNNTDMSCLNHIFYGGDVLNPAVEDKVNELLLSAGAQRKIAKGYGATEMTSAVTVTYDECNGIGSIGIPLPKMICKIVEPETFEELTYDKEGEVCFTGPSLMNGYYNNDEATNELIKVHPDGHKWVHTGDLGYVTNDGIIYITGRIKRIMITKGTDNIATKLFPNRIEMVIRKHQAVESCCVIGRHDENRINVAKAFIVLKSGCIESDEIKQEIINLCKNELPQYMWIEELEFRKSLPRTPRGKVDFRALEIETNGK